MTRYLITFFLLISELNVLAQSDSSGLDDYVKIDSLVTSLEKKNPRKKVLKNCLGLDSINGTRIQSIEKQAFKNLVKYHVKTSETGTTMSIKDIELYLFNDTLTKACIYYSQDRNNFWKKFYFTDGVFIGLSAFPFDMPIFLDENGQEYIILSKRLSSLEH